jgi:hypothetical protein
MKLRPEAELVWSLCLSYFYFLNRHSGACVIKRVILLLEEEQSRHACERGHNSNMVMAR